MIIGKSMSEDWLSNTWLVADKPGGRAVVIDTGAPTEPIRRKLEELGLTVTHALCTHHHVDHVANSPYYRKLGAEICGHAREEHLFDRLDRTLADGETIVTGDLRIKALHIPGHTLGQLAFLVDDERVFTGDTLFRGSIGGTRGPGHTTYEDIHRSIMDILMKLPPETIVHPGHMGPTTIGQEWESNPFIRIWRGLDDPEIKRCTAMGRPADLVLRATDYDGGTKCWVRFDDGDRLDIVAGSQVRDMKS
jgi:hydroxyacylglutathione hydrolase